MSKDLSSIKESHTDSATRKPLAPIIGVFLVVISFIVLFVVGQFVGSIFFVSLLQLAGNNTEQITALLQDDTLAQFGIVFFAHSSTVILALLSIKHIYQFKKFWFKKVLKSLLIYNRPRLGHLGRAIIAYGQYFLCFLVIVFFANSLVPGLDVEQEQIIGFSQPQGLGYLIVYMSLVILPSLSEEILFRGFLYVQLRKITRSIKISAIITSLVFGVAHLEILSGGSLNYIAGIDTFILSLFMVYLVQKTNSLWPAIFLHAIKNSIAFIVLFVR